MIDFQLFDAGRNIINARDAKQADVAPERIAARLANIVRFQGDPLAIDVLAHQMHVRQLALNIGMVTDVAAELLIHDIVEAFTGDYNGLVKPAACHELEGNVRRWLYTLGWAAPVTSPAVHLLDKIGMEIEIQHMSQGQQLHVEYSIPEWVKLVHGYGLFKCAS